MTQRSFLKQTCIVEEPARLQSGLPASLNWSEQTEEQLVLLFGVTVIGDSVQARRGAERFRQDEADRERDRSSHVCHYGRVNTKRALLSRPNSHRLQSLFTGTKVASVQRESLRLQCPCLRVASILILILILMLECQAVINMSINCQTRVH